MMKEVAMSKGHNLNVGYLRKAAKHLMRSLKDAQAEALIDVAPYHPKYTRKTPAQLVGDAFSLFYGSSMCDRRRDDAGRGVVWNAGRHNHRASVDTAYSRAT
jgi:hypothetical protein